MYKLNLLPQSCINSCDARCVKLITSIFSEIPSKITIDKEIYDINSISLKVEDIDQVNTNYKYQCSLRYSYDFEERKWHGGPCDTFSLEKLTNALHTTDQEELNKMEKKSKNERGA